jgi:competence protein ComEA
VEAACESQRRRKQKHVESVPASWHEFVIQPCAFPGQTWLVPEFQLTRRQIVVGVVALLALAFFASKLVLRPKAVAAPPIPTATSTDTAPPPLLYVDVVGAVRRPGLYRLAQGARVADALARAGGPTRKADLELVNLAAPIADGEQVVVPRRGTAGGGAGPAGAGGSTAGPVHLNTATLEQLDALPGIGPVTAQKILDYRQQHGAFSSVEELDAVPGIGPARLEQLKGLVAP